MVGALHCPGGRAIIALPACHAKTDSSTIVGRLADPVTSFQRTAVVTEVGEGRSVRALSRQISQCRRPLARGARARR